VNTTSGETVQSDQAQRTGGRRVGRRVAAVAFGLGLVVAAEVLCRLLGWGDPRLREDPFVGFSGTRPLFIKTDDGDSYMVPRVRQEYFARESFPVKKGERTRRIFCLGGSTVQGRPWSIPTSFTTWLELALNVADAEHDWDVINCGGISYASYRLVPILEECLQYEPDLIIICTGHNEFLEDRTYPASLRSPLLHRTSQLRLVNLAGRLIDLRQQGEAPAGRTAERATLPVETEPILNFEGGLAAYHRDDNWREGVAEHYEVNLRRMVGLVQKAGLPLVLMKPSSNLRDCPPFKWELRDDFSPAQSDRWGELIARAQHLRDQAPLESLQLLQQTLEMDPANPLTHFHLGRTQLALRDTFAAREALVAARDLDVCPLRMTSPLEERLSRVAEDEGLPLLDVHALLEGLARDEILGDEWLVDHIHPSIEGHQKIADALVVQLSEMGLVTLPDNWQPPARKVWGEHLATLDSAYFLRGQRMLEGLRAWSQGRADGPAAAERFPQRIQRSR
jgi:lysophospholipase L1-like esterase